MRLSILVPFRDADGTRTPSKEWIVKRWAYYWPEAEIIEASDDGVDPFNKSMAVNKAAEQATGDVYIILDADTWADPAVVRQGLALLEAKSPAPWVIPCRSAYRLRQDVSQQLMQLEPAQPLPPISGKHAETGRAMVVGFLWIVPRLAFERVGGMDERIRGWGGEDTLFTRAMTVINGVPRRGTGNLISLWHPRPRDSRGQRVWVGQGERSQETDKQELARRYGMARTPALMREVLAR